MIPISKSFFTGLDYTCIFITLLSVVIGLVRGFTKDFFSTCAWFGSMSLSVFGAPYLVPLINKYVTNITIAKSVAIGLSYILTLVSLLFIVDATSKKIKGTFFSGIDRALGMLFGLVRGVGILICTCIGFLTFDFQPANSEAIKKSQVASRIFSFSATIMPEVAESTRKKIHANTPSKAQKYIKKLSDDIPNSMIAPIFKQGHKQESKPEHKPENNIENKLKKQRSEKLRQIIKKKLDNSQL